MKTNNVNEIRTALNNNVQKVNNIMNNSSNNNVIPVKINNAQIQSMFKNSFTYVVYRYFKHNADMKTYSKFLNRTVTLEEFDKWKCSDDSLAEFQSFVVWYCKHSPKVVKAIRNSLSLMMEDEYEDFITNDLYHSFKKFIQFVDWVNFRRFVSETQHTHKEVYRRSDFEDWKDMYSESDFTSVIHFMLSNDSDDLFRESCQKCCQ